MWNCNIAEVMIELKAVLSQKIVILNPVSSGQLKSHSVAIVSRKNTATTPNESTVKTPVHGKSNSLWSCQTVNFLLPVSLRQNNSDWSQIHPLLCILVTVSKHKVCRRPFPIIPMIRNLNGLFVYDGDFARFTTMSNRCKRSNIDGMATSSS